MFVSNKFTEKGIINNLIFTFQNGDYKEVNIAASIYFNGKSILLKATINTKDWLKACEDYIFSEHYKRYSAD